ncbi:hypothetical protein WT60_27090 [Burkholderia sp. MSMB617WGS]|nr:hypothetical protein WT60_27090 [Burkholderia sp. MSMB617WGS]
MTQLRPSPASVEYRRPCVVIGCIGSERSRTTDRTKSRAPFESRCAHDDPSTHDNCELGSRGCPADGQPPAASRTSCRIA